tara:strand:+ start:448 stop:1590 length:1143 start_codon:yes stop_codon:yes gene_type:complete
MYLAHEVENGKRCGCHCPACRHPLVAANKGRKQIPHFRHTAAQSCEYGRSEGIRRAAVQLIAERKALLLAGYQAELRRTAKSGVVCSEQIEFDVSLIHADSVERFVDLGGVRAHALVAVQGRQLAVRIKCSARNEHRRWQYMKELNLASMEIDLHGLTDEQINDKAFFEQAVLADSDNRRWIRSLRAEQLEAHSLLQLQNQVELLNQQWEIDLLAKLEAAEAQKKKDAEERRKRQAAEAEHRALQYREAMEQSQPQKTVASEVLVERKAMIIVTMFQAVREWDGKALECSACRLMNDPAAEFCRYCENKNSQLSLRSFPLDLEKSIHNRMRSSVAPENSLKNVSRLTLVPEVLKADSAKQGEERVLSIQKVNRNRLADEL